VNKMKNTEKSINMSESKKKFFKEHPEARLQISNQSKLNWTKEEYRKMQSAKRIGKTSHRKGKSMLEEYGEEKAKEISQRISNTLIKNKSSSFNHDNLKFNNVLKTKIKNKYNSTCQLCKRFSYYLQIHHIDFNKDNNKEENLVCLCPECHGKTNGHKWVNYQMYFLSKMNLRNDIIPLNSKLWLNDEYNNFVNKLNIERENQIWIQG